MLYFLQRRAVTVHYLGQQMGKKNICFSHLNMWNTISALDECVILTLCKRRIFGFCSIFDCRWCILHKRKKHITRKNVSIKPGSTWKLKNSLRIKNFIKPCSSIFDLYFRIYWIIYLLPKYNLNSIKFEPLVPIVNGKKYLLTQIYWLCMPIFIL